MVVDHGGIHLVRIVSHEGAISTLRDDDLGVGDVDDLRLLFSASALALAACLAAGATLLPRILTHLTRVILRALKVGHGGLLLLHTLAHSEVEPR